MRLLALGSLAVDGTDFARRKPLLLLAYLGLEGPTTRARLARLFWPQASDPRDSLSTALRRLHKAMPACVVDEGRLSTTLASDAVELLAATERLARDAHLDPAAANDVLATYAGPFAPSAEARLGPELEEWVFATRERITVRVCAVRLRLAELHVPYGRPREALPQALGALELPHAPDPSASELRRLARLFDACDAPELRAVLQLAEATGVAIGARDLAGGVPNNLPPARPPSLVERRKWSTWTRLSPPTPPTGDAARPGRHRHVASRTRDLPSGRGARVG